MIKLKYFALGVAVTFLVTAYFYYLHPRAPQIITKIIEVPADQKPDLKIKSRGKLTGRLPVTPLPSPGSVVRDENQPPETPFEEGAILALKTGTYKTELIGVVKTEYFNSDGARIGEGEHPATAELTTIVLPEGLVYELDYPDSLSIQIESKPPLEPYLIGRLYIDGNIDLEFRGNVWGLHPFGIIQYDREKNNTRLNAGIEVEL